MSSMVHHAPTVDQVSTHKPKGGETQRRRARGSLRFQLSPSVGGGALDGAWWPYGHDLTVQARDLADQPPSSLGTIIRLIYSAPDWDTGPGRIRTDSAFLTLASFPGDDTHRVLLRRVGGRDLLQILVVPPEWDEGPARLTMQAATTPGNHKSAAYILIECKDRAEADEHASTSQASGWSKT